MLSVKTFERFAAAVKENPRSQILDDMALGKIARLLLQGQQQIDGAKNLQEHTEREQALAAHIAAALQDIANKHYDAAFAALERGATADALRPSQ